MEEYKFSCGGEELAKVLYYYGFLSNPNYLERKIVCPFHEDVNPSMMLDYEEGSYFCFGCAKSGNAFSFVREINSAMNDLQAGIKYFEILKSDRVEKFKMSPRYKKAKRLPKQMYTEAYDYYHGLRKVNWKTDDAEEVLQAKEYMKQRGFSASTLNKCKAKVNYNQAYGLIFPMLDNGKFKGWVCRTMLKAIEQKRKYLYNEGFSRATTLVGNYGSKNYVFVVEGFMDRLKFIQYGEENVVAILGWKMSHEQEQKLRDKGVTHIISALDNDECGRKGTKYLKTIFSVTRFVYPTGVKDPGEMSEEMFRKAYRKTMNKMAQETADS